jgi:hypothetical protein
MKVDKFFYFWFGVKIMQIPAQNPTQNKKI